MRQKNEWMKGNIYRKSRHKRSRNPICGLVKLHPKTQKKDKENENQKNAPELPKSEL